MRLGWLDRILWEIDVALWQLRDAIHQSTKAVCDLETVDDQRTLVATDGALVSIIEIMGTHTTIGDADLVDVVERLSSQLGAYLRLQEHALQVVFECDTSEDRVRRQITDASAPTLATVRRLQLDLLDVEREKMATLSKYCNVERVYVVAWTTRAGLTPIEKRHATRARVKLAKARPAAVTSQFADAGIDALRESHNTLIDAVVEDLRNVRISASILSADAALRAIRTMVDPEWTDEKWRASHPADGVEAGAHRARAPERGSPARDVSSFLWPRLPEQLIPRGFEAVSPTRVRVGDRLYMPLVVSIPPAVLQPFQSLFTRLRATGIPYRISWRIVGNGTGTFEFKLRHTVSYLSTSRSAKQAMSEAVDASRSKEIRVGLIISACTWVVGDDEDLLRRNAAKLARAIQGWGGCEVDDRLGDPARPLFSTIPAIRRGGSGPLSVPPIAAAVSMLPLARPASAWRQGSMLFRTPDGKLYPYQPYSSQQNAWSTLIYAPMGRGKSVLLNAFNKSLAISAGLDSLPRIAILDIGPSSAGVISLLREALPASLQHQVLYRRLRMLREDAINPADLPLGMRAPLPYHRQFIVNLLTILATPVEGDTPMDVPQLAGTVVDMAYREFGDGGSRMRRYDRQVDLEVDRLIEDLGIPVDERTTWWEITDALFEAEQVHGATLAQRHAVPLVGEMAALARDPIVMQQFKGFAQNQEPICEYFYKAVSTAVREYPILATATRLDLGAARIVSLDLAEVVPQGGPTADRQASVMYMLARHALASDLFLHQDLVDLATMPVQYRSHHLRVITRMREAPKRLCFDEFHRTRRTPLVREQVVLDIREGRKANLDIVLASQRLEDFDDVMVDLATSIFILGVGERSLESAVKTFGLNDYAAGVLGNLGAPTAAGARMLAIFQTKEHRYVADIVNTLSPTEIWSYSSTAEDRGLRDRLYVAVGATTARRLLVRHYPLGTAKPEVERRQLAMVSERGLDEEDARETVIETMVRELVSGFEKDRSQAA